MHARRIGRRTVRLIMKITFLHGIVFFTVFLSSCAVPNSAPLSVESPTFTQMTAPDRTPISSPQNQVWESAKKIPPEDIFQEVGYYGGGGSILSICQGETSPTLLYLDLTEEVTKHGEIRITSCGWNIDEEINIRIVRPDGIEISETQKTVSSKQYVGDEPDVGLLIYAFFTGVNDPSGTYRIYIMKGYQLYFQLALGISPPDYPIINYSYFFERKNHIDLLGFAPQERIRLFSYDCSDISIKPACEFVEWVYITTDERGQAVIPAAESDYDFVAVGDISGLAKNYFSEIGVPLRCGNSLSTELRLSEELSLFHDIYIYQSPGSPPQLITAVKSKWEITDGPICKGDERWWKIRNMYSIEGWVPESSVRQEVIVATGTPTFLCGELPSRLTKGNRGRISFIDGTKTRIRTSPGLLQSILYEVAEGTAFSIIEGPQCVDNLVWWKIVIDGSLEEGWVAEFDNERYLLELAS
jgi:hypothetical protein